MRAGDQDLPIDGAQGLHEHLLMGSVELRSKVVDADDRPLAARIREDARLRKDAGERAEFLLTAREMLAARRVLERNRPVRAMRAARREAAAEVVLARGGEELQRIAFGTPAGFQADRRLAE